MSSASPLPLATTGLIGLNVLVYALHWINLQRASHNDQADQGPGGRFNLFASTGPEGWALRPTQLWTSPRTEWPTVMSSVFTHANLAHLVLNMYGLWRFGGPLEQSLASSSGAAGPVNRKEAAVKMLVLFLGSGILTNLVYATIHGAGQNGTTGAAGVVGASGAISGISAAYFLRFGERRNMQAWLAYQVAGLLLASGSNVSYSSHLIGFVVGALLYWLIV